MKTDYQEAEDFLADVFGGYHHIPSEIKQWGDGWYIWTRRNLATYDSNLLTRLVVLAHDNLFRVEITSYGFHGVKIIVHKRIGREGKMFERLPQMETAIQMIRPKTTIKDFIVKESAAN